MHSSKLLSLSPSFYVYLYLCTSVSVSICLSFFSIFFSWGLFFSLLQRSPGLEIVFSHVNIIDTIKLASDHYVERSWKLWIIGKFNSENTINIWSQQKFEFCGISCAPRTTDTIVGLCDLHQALCVYLGSYWILYNKRHGRTGMSYPLPRNYLISKV